MRPMTWFVSGAAVVGLLVLGGIMVRFGCRGGPTQAAAEDESSPIERPPPIDAAVTRPATRPAPWAAMGRRRPLPRFDPSVLTPLPPPRATAQDLERVRTVARQDGALFREIGSDKVYVVMRGAKFLIPNGDEMAALGYETQNVNEVPVGALGALQDRPPEGTLIRERGKEHIWVYEGGKKRHITSAWVFGVKGYDWKDVKTVPVGSIGDYGDGAPVQ
jgi:hypothetical protein